MEQNTINIFLASSNELKEDRVWFGDFVQGIDKIYQERGKGVDVFKWEFFDAANNDVSKQGEYDNEIRKSNMFLALFHTKAGKFTLHEYGMAMDTYRKTKKFPKVYVYFRALQEGEEETPELLAFKAELSKDSKEYFWITYSTRDQLHLHFLQQLLMVENSLDKLKYEEGKVMLEGMHVADIDNLPFAKENRDYQRISAELCTLPKDIDSARQYVDEHPDNDFAREELQKKLNRYNELKEEFAQLQKTLFETSQRIATMQCEQLNDKLRNANEAFEIGNLERASTLLDEIINGADSDFEGLKEVLAPYHQKTEALLLRAKTVMLEVKTPIVERIKQVQAIYAKADKWADDSKLPDDKYERLLVDYSNFLYDYGLYKEAEPIDIRLTVLREKLYGKDHPNTAKSYNSIGEVYRNQGNYAKALEYYEKALDIWERALGPYHPLTATSYNNIGLVYHSQGEYAKALEYYKKDLEICKRLLGSDHPNTAMAYNNIGVVYYNQGNYSKALENFGKTLDIRERVLGLDHPDTAQSYNNIGAVYHSQNNYDKALEYYGKALDIYEQVLGPDHPDTAGSYNNIGAVYDNQGDYAKALEYLKKALDIYEQTLGPDHPDTATSYNNIGAVYKSQGDYAKALEYYEKALDIWERLLGPDHLNTAQSYNNIASVYCSQGNYAKALEYYGKALDIRKRVLGPDHLDTASSYNNIAGIYFSNGDYHNALEYLSKTLNILERKLGSDHLNSKTVRENMEICRELMKG